MSEYIPFTILSATGVVIATAFYYYTIVVEEEVNIGKWDDRYKQYMKEVPRLNFIKSLWNIIKTRRS